MSKKPVNRNFIWAQAFVNQLYGLGVRYACISPGSRSTPLTVAFANQKGIKCFVNIDERVYGFFVLGLVKATDIVVVNSVNFDAATESAIESSLDDLLNMMYIHPALPEIVRNAARKAKVTFEESKNYETIP